MKSNFEWQAWGKHDPLYGVASWSGRERGGANPWTDEDFYKLSDDWLDFKQAWIASVGFDASGTVIEIGSGAGRITRALSAEFANVVATDVSADILSYAKKRVRSDNIDWRQSDGDEIPAEAESADALFSCHVFQHFPSTADQLATFRDAHRVLKRGGTFFVHLPIHVFPETGHRIPSMFAKLYSLIVILASTKAAVRRFLMRFGGKPYMHGVSYEMKSLLADLRAIGFGDLSVQGISVRNGYQVHSCVVGRKL